MARLGSARSDAAACAELDRRLAPCRSVQTLLLPTLLGLLLVGFALTPHVADTIAVHVHIHVMMLPDLAIHHAATRFMDTPRRVVSMLVALQIDEPSSGRDRR